MSIFGDFFQRQAEIEEEQAMIAGFHGILETEKQRRKMSPTELAIRLSKCDKDSPAYVLLSHELNCRIAGIQARATYAGIVIGLIGVVFGALLTTAIQKNPTINCNCSKENASKMEIPPSVKSQAKPFPQYQITPEYK